MPTYVYQCNAEGCEYEFETIHSIKADPLRECPECGEPSLHSKVFAVPVMVRGEVKTLGHQADRNRDKMGKYEYQEKCEELRVRKAHGRTELLKEAEAPWWRPGTDKPNPQLATMTPEEANKYRTKGTTPTREAEWR